MRGVLLVISLLSSFISTHVLADSGQAAKQLDQLKAAISSGEADLDTYFAYAKAVEKAGEASKAIAAYEKMLQQNPSLDRVKLDLGLLLAKNNQIREARLLFREVLDKATTPPQVRMNIKRIMEQIEQADKVHRLSGSIFAGFNYDTNAIAVPNGERVLIQDQLRELTAPDQRDGHVFVSANLSHERTLHKDNRLQSKWVSAVNAFETEQAKLPELELRVVGVRTGPVIHYAPWKAELGLQIGYNRVELEGEEYLNLGNIGVRLSHKWTDKTTLTNNLSMENRQFVNSATSPVLSQRSGHAVQNMFAVTHRVSEQGIVTGSLMIRRENTHEEYYDYDRYELGVNYTRLFTETLSATLNSRLRWTHYDGPDPLITISKTRSDYEKIAEFSLTKRLPHDFLVNVGYQFNDVKSNLPNFDYNNHRILTSVGWQF